MHAWVDGDGLAELTQLLEEPTLLDREHSPVLTRFGEVLRPWVDEHHQLDSSADAHSLHLSLNFGKR